MMKSKIAILCLTHSIDDHFKLLVKHLSQDFDLYVHFDKKNEILYKKDILNVKINFKDNVYFIDNNINVYWGGDSQILAEYILLKEAYRVNPHYTHYLLISGSDFPIKSNNYIKNLLENNLKVSFIQCTELPAKGWGLNGGLDRYQRYWFTDFKNRQNTRIFGKITLYLQKFFMIRRKDYFNKYYGGANWGNLSRDAVGYIINAISQDKRLLDSFKWTRACDEIWKQSILKTSPLNVIVNDCLRYVDWSGKYPPKVLTISDFDKLINSNALFARKMNGSDLSLQQKLLDRFNHEKI